MPNNVRVKIKERDLGYKIFRKANKEIAKYNVMSGYFRGDKTNGKEVAYIASIQDLGARNGIPSRPFLRNSVDKNKKKITFFLMKMIEKMFLGKVRPAFFFKFTGEFMVSGIKKSIRDTNTPPLKQKTIKQKKSSTPLIDSGQMIQATKYKILKRK